MPQNLRFWSLTLELHYDMISHSIEEGSENHEKN